MPSPGSRERAATEPPPSRRKQGFCDHIGRSATRTLAGLALEKGKERRPPARKSIPTAVRALHDVEAAAVFRREQLLVNLRWHLTEFWKNQVPEECKWQPCGVTELKACIRQVLRFQRQSAKLSHNVQLAVSANLLCESSEQVGNERSIQERQEHRQEFWAKYRSKLEKSELPLAKKPIARRAHGEARSRSEPKRSLHSTRGQLACGPLETGGDFWQVAVSPQCETKTRLKRSSRLETTEKVRKKMQWTQRGARDTCGFGGRRWALGRQFAREDPDSDDSDEELAEQEHADELPKMPEQGSQSPEKWKSEIADVVAAAIAMAATEKSESEPQAEDGLSWNITGLPLSRRGSKSFSSSPCRKQVQKELVPIKPKVLRSKVDARREPQMVQPTMGSKSISLPDLTSRGVFRSMYRPRDAPLQKKPVLDAQLPRIVNVVKESTSPTKRYVKVCQKYGVLPTPMPCITGQSAKLDASDRALSDDDLLAFIAILRSMDRLEEVELAGNTLLTEKVFVTLFRKLFGPPASSSLERLSIKGCLHAARVPMEILVQLLNSPKGLQKLRHLDLGSVPIAMRCYLPLAEAVHSHPCLTSLSLGDTGLGNSPVVMQCVAQLLSSSSVEVLDLGWNPFSAEVFSHLGEILVETQALRSLSLANCSAAYLDPTATPVMFFLERLAKDKALQFLDISLNRIDFHGALTLEDALEKHGRLAKIDISQNPMGVLGMRRVLRLLARDSSGLVDVVCESCLALSQPGHGINAFRWAVPTGDYALDLSQPYNRSILRMLYKACEHLKISPLKAFENVMFSSPPYCHPSGRDSTGVWPVPTKGKLTLHFDPLRAMDVVEKSATEKLWRPHLESFLDGLKLKPGLHKMVALVLLWRNLEGRMREQRAMLEAMSRDFLFTYPQMQQICESRLFCSSAICTLFHCISGGDTARFLCYLLSPSLGEQVGIHKKVSKFLDTNVENPTGHYCLDLSNTLDLASAEQLFLLDRWEMRLSQLRTEFPDTSQRGNSSQIRNELYQKQQMCLPVVSNWSLPETGIFEFDYVSTRRPPKEAIQLSNNTFDELVDTLRMSKCDSNDQVRTLRRVSSDIWCTAMQLRKLMMMVTDEECVDEIVVAFFFRVVDIWNSKVFHVRYHNWESLSRRLGHVNVFLFFQPEHVQYEFDFSWYDQRVAANIFLILTNKEKSGGNGIKNPSYTNADGVKDSSLDKGVPRIWQRLDGLPHVGIFKATFICAPEERQLPERKRLCRHFGRWHTDAVTVADIEWWVASSDIQGEFIDYLARLLPQYHNPQSAFLAIDRAQNRGAINRRQFDQHAQEMMPSIKERCNSRDSQPFIEGRKRSVSMDSQSRDRELDLRSIFRRLDSSGEGWISHKEWEALDDLWKELRLSITEYIDCVSGPFGGDLRAAWKELDKDGSGSLDEKEWCDAAKRFHYHGPAKPVFRFLEQDGDGIVTLQKFLALARLPSEPPQFPKLK